MIIIKISILYFIQIRHTDDFPSTGTRLVRDNLAKSNIWMTPSPRPFILFIVDCNRML